MTRIVAAPAEGFSARFTTAEFLRMIEAGVFGDDKVESIEGELHRIPPPGNSHGHGQAMVVGRLFRVADEALVRGRRRSVIHVHAEPVDGDHVDIHSVRFGRPLAVPGTDATITLN